MNAIFFIFAYLLASVLSVSTESQKYCQIWYGSAIQECLAKLEDDVDVIPNIMFLQNKRVITPSICENIYLTWNKETYQEEMTMSSTAPSNPAAGSSAGENDFSKFPVKKFHDLRYDGWMNAIPDSVTHFRHYNIDAILNLLQYHYYKKDSNLRLVFSRQQLIDIYGEIVSPLTILEYLQAQGVCTESEYASEVAAGRKSNPRCLRYRLTSFKRLRPADTVTLVEEVIKRPLFVQLALNPYYTQLYSFKCTNYAVDKGYYCMTYAGVLSGYDYQNVKFPHFQVWVSRHGNNNNLVRVKLMSEAVFGSINSVVYEISIDEIATPTEAPIVPTEAPIIPTEAPIVPTEAPIVPTEAPIVPTEAPIVPTEAPIIPTEAPIIPTEAPIIPTEAPIVPTETPEVPVDRITCNGKTMDEYYANNNYNIPNDCFNDPRITVLDLNKYPLAKYVTIGQRSFRYVRLFHAVDHLAVMNIRFNADSFSLTNRLDGEGSNRVDQNNNKVRVLSEKRRFEVVNCPGLKIIHLFEGAMADYYHFNVSNNAILRDIYIGNVNSNSIITQQSFNFHYATRFHITDMPMLVFLKVAGEAFRYSYDTKIEGCPILNNIELGSHAWAGEDSTEATVTLKGIEKINFFKAYNAMNYVNQVKALGFYNNDNIPTVFNFIHLNPNTVDANGKYTERTFGNVAVLQQSGTVSAEFVSALRAASGVETL